MKTKIQDTIDFINYLRWSSFVDINYLYSKPKRLEDIFWKEQWFFVCWLWEKLNRRSSDKDIKTKKYFVVDIDIRLDYLKKEKIILSQEELIEQADTIITVLEEEWFDDYSYSVMTWNWIHLYYTWDEQEFWIKEYEYWVSVVFDKIDHILKDTPYKTDKATSNIWRLSRIPWTYNPRKKEKTEFILDDKWNKIKSSKWWYETKTTELFNLWNTECYIIKKQEQQSKRFTNIKKYATNRLEEDKANKAINKHNADERIFKEKLTSNSSNIYEMICDIPVLDMFVSDFWFELKQWKYFYSWTKREWAVFFEDGNKIYHWWCSAWDWWEEWKIYNPYWYIKEREKLNDAWVFRWFEENYQDIKQQSEKNREARKCNNNQDTQQMKVEDCFEHNWHYFTLWLEKLDKRYWMPETWDLVLLAWYPWSWKTEYAYFMARQNSKNCNVLYFTLELPEDSMKKRLARNTAWISKYEYQMKTYTNTQKEKMDQKYNGLDLYKNIEYISYEQSPTVDTIIDEIKKRDTEFVVIDALWNMWWDANEITRLSSITKQLRLLVKNNNICVVLIHHMNKPRTEMESLKPWWLAKLRWTQKIVDDSSIILEVWRDQDPEQEDTKEKATVKIYQLKDTIWWVTWVSNIYYNRWEYENDYIQTNF